MTIAGKESMKATRRVLIYRLGSLGDMVVALPALHLVARAFPHAERRMMTNFPVNTKASPAAEILEGTGLVHGYFHYHVGVRGLSAVLSLWWQLLRWRPQTLVYLGAGRGIRAARRDAIFFRLCGVQRLIGVPVTERMQRSQWIEREQALEPEAERLVRNLAELGTVDMNSPENWSLHLTEIEHRRVAETLQPVAGYPLIAVSIGTKRQSNDWGRDNWRTLLTILAEAYPSHALVLAGAVEERELSDDVAQGWSEAAAFRVVNLCGLLMPRESAAVFARASVFIGHDSGPVHLAASVQTPCVAIYSARNKPRLWFPYGREHRVIYHQVDCWGCRLETCIVEKKKCMTSIHVDEVLAQVYAVLGQQTAFRVPAQDS